MSCRTVRGWLPAYLADSLGEEERQEFRAHVRNCPGCRRWLWQQEATVALALALPARDTADGEFVDEVLAGIHQRRVERALARKKRTWRRAAAAAAALLALGLAYERWPRSPQPQVVAQPVQEKPAPEPFVEVEGEGVRVYQLASGGDARTQVALIVSPSVEL
ncbi:MAG: zf-HC2 domain-containing protein [Thermoanaerobaculum sp.]